VIALSKTSEKNKIVIKMSNHLIRQETPWLISSAKNKHMRDKNDMKTQKISPNLVSQSNLRYASFTNYHLSCCN